MKIAPLILITCSAFAGPVEWKMSDGGNGHSYELVGNFNVTTQRWNWEQCRRMAWMAGGHLATITSAAENQFIISNVMKTNSLPTWIGLTDQKQWGGHDFKGLANPQTNGWAWITGEPIQYTFWQTSQPDLEQQNQNCAAIGSYLQKTFQWDNFQQGDTCQFLIEYDSFAVRIQNKKPQIVWPTISTNGCVLEWSENLRDWKTEGLFPPTFALSVHSPTNLHPIRFYRLLLLP
jgi:hypothetical protein